MGKINNKKHICELCGKKSSNWYMIKIRNKEIYFCSIKHLDEYERKNI